jgi:predicted secreted Zn-dependent protease
MEADELPADKLVAVYRKIRAAIDKKEEAHKAEIAAMREKLDVVSTKLLEICNTQNLDSLRTPAGTVTRRTVTRYWTSDWESMYRFIKEQDAPYLLEQRIHNGNMRQFLEDNPETLPIGLNADTKYAITVRKPTNK